MQSASAIPLLTFALAPMSGLPTLRVRASGPPTFRVREFDTRRAKAWCHAFRGRSVLMPGGGGGSVRMFGLCMFTVREFGGSAFVVRSFVARAFGCGVKVRRVGMRIRNVRRPKASRCRKVHAKTLAGTRTGARPFASPPR